MRDHARTDVLGFSQAISAQKTELKVFLSANFYHHPRVLRLTRKAEWVVGDHFRTYRETPALLPPRVREQFSVEEPKRVIADHVAGMTDRYAMSEHRKLLDPHEVA